jgi:TfoX/Sxy family transcriptional regulator of competence genes
MPYNETLNNRIREAVADLPNVEEKAMFGGICYMVNGKMCMGVVKDEMMCRIDPALYEESLEKTGCREMVFTGRPMKGYVFISEDGMKTKKEFDHWIALCLDFNKRSRAAKKKKRAGKG